MCTWQACNEEVFSLRPSRMLASQYIVGMCTIYEAMSCHVTHICVRLYIYFNHFKCVCVTTSAGQRCHRRMARIFSGTLVQSYESRIPSSESSVPCPRIVVVWKLDNDLWGVKSNFILISFHFQPALCLVPSTALKLKMSAHETRKMPE